MFLDSGDGTVFKGDLGPWYQPGRGEFHLDRDQARDLVGRAVKHYEEKRGRLPAELFIHGKARFTDQEWEGFREAVPEGTHLVGVRIRDAAWLKLYRTGRHAALRTLAYVEREGLAYLWTKGFVPRLRTYPGLEVPRPLLVDVCRGEASMKVVLQDILALTKLNYNSCIFADGQPVTLRFANAVGEILTAGPTTTTPPLPFKYYI